MADLANHSWAADTNSTPHLLSALMDNPPTPDNGAHSRIIPPDLDVYITMILPLDCSVALLCYLDIYVDYFIALHQGGTADRRRVCNQVFHNMEKVFRPNNLGKQMRQESKSAKNLKKGLYGVGTCKRILG